MLTQLMNRTSFDPMDYPRIFRLVMNSWPPFLGAAISVESIEPDWRKITVTMKLRWYNRNYVNCHFGGSLCSMTDPFYMLMLMRNLGRDYIVWDASARIKFVQPGRSKVTAHFILDAERIAGIRERVVQQGRLLEKFRVDIVDDRGELVAIVNKTLYINNKISGEKNGSS